MLHREFGDLAAATAELTAAVRLARASGSPERESDVLATPGVTLTYRGHSRRGLAALGRSLTLVGGEAAARVLVRRGIALWVLGRHAEALDDLGRSIRCCGRPATASSRPGRAPPGRWSTWPAVPRAGPSWTWPAPIT
jgi:hypothetical protein